MNYGQKQQKKIINSIVLLLVVFICNSCVTKESNIIKRNEIQIIKNKLESNKELVIKLREKYTINLFENSNFIAKYPSSFDVDDNGNLYLLDILTSEIHKFSAQGKYLFSFGNKGNGPGETIFPNSLVISGEKIILASMRVRKCVIYNTNGEYIKEYVTEGGISELSQLNSERFLGFKSYNKEGKKVFSLDLCNRKFSTINTMYKYSFKIKKENPFNFYLDAFPPKAISNENFIISNNKDNEYSFSVYNNVGVKIKDVSFNYRSLKFKDWEQKAFLQDFNLMEKGLVTKNDNLAKKSINYIINENSEFTWILPSVERKDSTDKAMVVDILKNFKWQKRIIFKNVKVNDFKSDNVIYKIKNSVFYKMSLVENKIEAFDIIR